MNVKGFRHRGSVYHDSVKRAFIDKDEIFLAEDIRASYRRDASIKLARHVVSILDAFVPHAIHQLIEADYATLSRVPEIPRKRPARAKLAAEIVQAWTAIVAIPDAERRKLAESLAGWILDPTNAPGSNAPTRAAATRDP